MTNLEQPAVNHTRLFIDFHQYLTACVALMVIDWRLVSLVESLLLTPSIFQQAGSPKLAQLSEVTILCELGLQIDFNNNQRFYRKYPLLVYEKETELDRKMVYVPTTEYKSGSL